MNHGKKETEDLEPISDLIWSCFGVRQWARVRDLASHLWLLIFHFLGWGAYIALLYLEEKIKLRKKTNREFSVGRQELKQGCSYGPGEKKMERKVPDTFVSRCWSLEGGAAGGVWWKLGGGQGCVPTPSCEASFPSLEGPENVPPVPVAFPTAHVATSLPPTALTSRGPQLRAVTT